MKRKRAFSGRPAKRARRPKVDELKERESAIRTRLEELGKLTERQALEVGQLEAKYTEEIAALEEQVKARRERFRDQKRELEKRHDQEMVELISAGDKKQLSQDLALAKHAQVMERVMSLPLDLQRFTAWFLGDEDLFVLRTLGPALRQAYYQQEVTRENVCGFNMVRAVLLAQKGEVTFPNVKHLDLIQYRRGEGPSQNFGKLWDDSNMPRFRFRAEAFPKLCSLEVLTVTPHVAHKGVTWLRLPVPWASDLDQLTTHFPKVEALEIEELEAGAELNVLPSLQPHPELKHLTLHHINLMDIDSDFFDDCLAEELAGITRENFPKLQSLAIGVAMNYEEGILDLQPEDYEGILEQFEGTGVSVTSSCVNL